MACEVTGVKYEEEFILNSRGMELFTCTWVPENCEPKALIFLCHGYAMECSLSMKGTGNRLALAGFAVYGMDYEGHGKSSGLQGFVPCFDDVVSDCSHHFSTVCEKEENVKKMRILMGESMGGAVVLLLHRKKPEFWDGAVLVAPMCKIAENVKPNPLLMTLLPKLCWIIPTCNIVPTPDIIDIAVRDPKIRNEIRSNPYCYKGWPRLQTAQQLLTISLDLEKRLQEVSLPFLIVHGEDDKVTDPNVSKLLYETASSSNKTIKLYPGMWHALTYGELPENTHRVLSDIIKWLDDWLDEKVKLGNSRLEREQKHKHDNGLEANSSRKEPVDLPQSPLTPI